MVAAVVIGVALVAARLMHQEPPVVVSTGSTTGKAGSTTDRAGVRWQHVLERLDVSRSRAWRLGRPDLLRDVYTGRSAELQRDRAMLRKYTHRNLEARGVRLAFGRVRVAGRADGVVRLDVVDQLRAVVVVDRDGRSAALPRDLPTRHSIVLRRTAAGWRIASVQRR